MPSPLSGLTQAAASPMSAQLAPATLLAGEAEVGAALVRVALHQRLDRDVGGPLGRRERADADVHLAATEGEDPPVARQRLPALAAQLEVAADPPVVGLGGVDVAAPR